MHRRARAAVLAIAGIGVVAVTTASSSTAPSGPKTVVRHTASAGAPTCGGVAIAKPTGGTWACTVDDEFSGTALDTTTWTPLNTAVVGNHPGQECDDPNALTVADGVLIISATRNPKITKCGRYSSKYNSGGVTSTFAQTYGRFSIRAMFPAGKGFQPAIWMLPKNPMGPAGYSYGEIDVAESYSYKPDVVSTHVHYVNTPNQVAGVACDVAGATTAFHTYTLQWTPQTLTFFYDNTTCWTTTWTPNSRYTPRGSTAPTPFNQPFYVIVNLAVGDYKTPRNQPDRRTQFPATMYVDYVRVWA